MIVKALFKRQTTRSTRCYYGKKRTGLSILFDNRSQKCRWEFALFWLVVPAYLPLKKSLF